MDTTNKHLGNILSQLSDKNMKEVLEQYMKKLQFTNGNESLIKYFQKVLVCEAFDYEGNMDDYDGYMEK